MISSISPSPMCIARLTRHSISVRKRALVFPTGTTARLASSIPPSGDGDSVESSAAHDTNGNIDSKSNGSSSSSSSSSSSGTTSTMFPWRHEPSPLPRLVPGTPEHKEIGLLLTSRSQRVYGNSSLNSIVTAYMFLNVPWYELFWISQFQDELSSNMSWSFTQGIASLLSKIPLHGGGDQHIPADRIITNHEDGTGEIDFCATFEMSRNNENGAHSVTVVNDDNGYGPKSDDDSMNNSTISLQQMFDQKAVELYQSSVSEAVTPERDPSGDPLEEEQNQQPKRLEIRLKMIPYDTEFITLYAIPYLSRRNAKAEPELLDFYGKMLNEASSARAPYLSQLRRDHLENRGYMESTIIAQCLVWCDELFYVKDLVTGKILQGREEAGSEDEDASSPRMQKTPHLVRMERTVVTKRDASTGTFTNEQENWIITDIDDLVGGNLVI